jgi:hypothetical protein
MNVQLLSSHRISYLLLVVSAAVAVVVTAVVAEEMVKEFDLEGSGHRDLQHEREEASKLEGNQGLESDVENLQALVVRAGDKVGCGAAKQTVLLGWAAEVLERVVGFVLGVVVIVLGVVVIVALPKVNDELEADSDAEETVVVVLLAGVGNRVGAPTVQLIVRLALLPALGHLLLAVCRWLGQTNPTRPLQGLQISKAVPQDVADLWTTLAGFCPPLEALRTS